MIIARLELEDWGPFPGKVVLDHLDTFPALGICGPNGAGKSALLDAVGYALYGRTRSRRVARWKRRGAAKMSVALTLRGESGDLYVKRGWRDTRDGSGKGSVELRGWEGSAGKHVRRDAVERALRLTWEDYVSTRYLAQADLQRLGNAEPRERRALVERWVARPVWPAALKLATEVQKLRQRTADRAEVMLSAARGAHARAVQRAEQWVKSGSSDEVAECERAVAAAVAQLAAHDALRPSESSELAHARAAEIDASKASTAARRNTEGCFDGVCPIVRDACPVAEDIRSKSAALERVFVDAERAAGAAQKRVRDLATAHASAHRDWAAKRQHLEDDLHMQRRHLDEAQRRAGGGAEVEASLERARRDLEKADAEHTRAIADSVVGGAVVHAIAGIAAAEVEESIARAEHGAGAVLRAMGVPVGVRFSHFKDDGQSALDVVIETEGGDDEFSDGSGGRKDLVSLALRLGFSRDVGALRFLLCDEVLRQLDGPNRRAVSQYLMGGGAAALGVDQVWVVAHDAAAIAAAPRVLEVLPDGGASRLSWLR